MNRAAELIQLARQAIDAAVGELPDEAECARAVFELGRASGMLELLHPMAPTEETAPDSGSPDGSAVQELLNVCGALDHDLAHVVATQAGKPVPTMQQFAAAWLPKLRAAVEGAVTR